ncbi:YicC family protein [Vicingaceae bacterium]|nr:YicC family protein [Vicingaceae bacterium]MDB4061790.1 YicC family protein [Vicingaceae bacterium]MDC1451766.1 YicC family protein [Vicingaceae bacterium]
MIHSMTGYGKAEGIIGNKKITIQLRSLNSKQADVSVKVPSIFKDQELIFRKEIAKELQRGKIEMYLSYESNEKDNSYEVDEEVFQRYYNQLSALNGKFKVDNSNLTATILKMPEILKAREKTVNKNDNAALLELLQKSLADINSFRTDEGKTLEADLTEHVNEIEGLLTEALKYEEERTAMVRARILSNLEDSQQKDKVDMDRFEQEMIFYMEKYDISEEKVRLKAHCDYFKKTISEGEGQGKKLGFISQEIGREVNTLGSKSNHAQMQKLVVQMKDKLEKIKEQVLNVL